MTNLTKRSVLSLKKIPVSLQKQELNSVPIQSIPPSQGKNKNQKNTKKQIFSHSKNKSKSSAQSQKQPNKKLKTVQPKIDSYKQFLEAQNRNYKVLNWLSELYPPLFQQKIIKPLKIGILQDLFESLAVLDKLPFSKVSIRKAISFYTHWYYYHEAIIQETYRYDLKGEAVEFITQDQKTYAQEKLTFYLDKKNIEKNTKKRSILKN